MFLFNRQALKKEYLTCLIGKPQKVLVLVAGTLRCGGGDKRMATKEGGWGQIFKVMELDP